MQIWNKIKEMIKKMVGGKSVEQALKVAPLISNKMADAIELWSDMYEGNAPWIHEPDYKDPTKITSLGLPAFIASEKARMAVLEMKSEITTPVEEVEVPNPNYNNTNPLALFSLEPETIMQEQPIGDTTRAEYLNKQYKKVLDKIRTQLEYGIAKGGLVIKPYVVKNTVIENGVEVEKCEIEFDFVQADGFFPLAFDGSGRVTDAAFIQPKVDKDTIYRRLERHTLNGNTITVQNKAFKSTNTRLDMDANGNSDLGQEVPLTSIPEWKDLEPTATIKNVDRLMFGYFKMPEANTVDTHSPLGVSGYSRAVNLIKEADMQYSRLLWEFEAGEMAIDIDRDALEFIENPDNPQSERSVITHLQKRLFRKVDLGESNTYQPYAPPLRDISLINGLNNILMRIEDVCALSRGTIADVAAEARTATELKILKQRSYSANAEIQKELERTLKDVVYIMNTYCTLYNAASDMQYDTMGNPINVEGIGQYEVSFEWDDSIIVDVNEELNKRLQLMQQGIDSKVEVRMWYHGETEQQAMEALAKVEQENQKAMQQNMMMQQSMFGGEV